MVLFIIINTSLPEPHEIRIKPKKASPKLLKTLIHQNYLPLATITASLILIILSTKKKKKKTKSKLKIVLSSFPARFFRGELHLRVVLL